MQLLHKTKLHLKGVYSEFNYSIKNKKLWRNQNCTALSIFKINKLQLN